MFAAVLTAFFFACSGICGQRSATALGSLRANMIRLAIAMMMLAALAAIMAPVPVSSPAIPWLLVSGLIGFGAGDISLFLAYPHLGARLTLLVNLCAAPVFGTLGEWLLTGDKPGAVQAGCCAVIILGVVIALGQQIRLPRAAGARPVIGLIAAVAAGAGQGLGATFTRVAKSRALAAGDHFTGISEACVRVVPGFALSALVWWLASRAGRRLASLPAGHRRWSWWVAGAALFGPVLGVSCFQWALGQASSAVVLSITATTPIIVIPMSAYMDGDRPGVITLAGSVIAVTGVILVLSAG